jgi:hypothetical protein
MIRSYTDLTRKPGICRRTRRLPSNPTRLSAAQLRRDQTARRRASALLWRQDSGPDQPFHVYAILDAAHDRGVYAGLQRFGAWHAVMPLYQGSEGDNLAAVGPHLVCLGRTEEIFDWIWENFWGDAWGIFLCSAASPDAVRLHFRRHRLARTADGERLVFRFYDPRVLLPFLPTCTAPQLRDFFGPVQRFVVQDDDGAALVTLHREAGRLITGTARLLQP